MNEKLTDIISHFTINKDIKSIKPASEGFINDTYFVYNLAASTPSYILQRKNHAIFNDVPKMMDNILKVTHHLKKKIEENGGNPERETLTLVATNDQQYYYQDSDGNYWIMMIFISNSITYNSASSPQIAYEGGRGLAQFHSFLSDFSDPLFDILPGFHQIEYRLNQWDTVLKNDVLFRSKEVVKEIDFIERHRHKMMEYRELCKSGDIPIRVAHNDTKMSNFLFDENGNCICTIDLDTVNRSSCLNDIGDAIRSYTNSAAEDEANLSLVNMNHTIYDAFKEGYFSVAQSFITPIERKYFDFSAYYITYEQVVRFLMDYLEGDHYYKINYPNHNLIRTRAQIKLFESYYF